MQVSTPLNKGYVIAELQKILKDIPVDVYQKAKDENDQYLKIANYVYPSLLSLFTIFIEDNKEKADNISHDDYTLVKDELEKALEEKKYLKEELKCLENRNDTRSEEFIQVAKQRDKFRKLFTNALEIINEITI
jgi:septal ring factor EnvC (AmiA/AmiB activator)